MRTKIIVAALAGLTMLSAAVPASAQVDYREHRQEQRIHQGERSGALTPREAGRLEDRERHIHYREANMRWRHNGHLSPHDRRVLRHRQNVTSRHIYRQKHDWQHRG